MKVEQAKEELAALNQRFRARQVLDSRFYHQLEDAGCDVRRSILVSLVPDGGDTYFGSIIRQDGRVLAFDLALANPAASVWEDETEDFLSRYHRLKKEKPWSPRVVAYEAFLVEREPM